MPLRDVLYEQDQEFSKDIDGYQISGAAVMTEEKSLVNGHDHGRDEKKEKDESAFEQTFEKTDLDAEAIVEVAAEVMVCRLLIEEIGAEIIALKTAAENKIAGIHIREKLVV